MVRVKNVPVRSARPTRISAKTSQAINSLLIGTKKKHRTDLSKQNTAVDFEVKRLKTKRKRNIKIKKLLAQPKHVEVRKNGQVVRRMTVRRKSYFPGRRRKVY